MVENVTDPESEIRVLKQYAKEGLDLFIATNNMNFNQLGGKPSLATIRRRLDPTDIIKYRSVDHWLSEIAPIYENARKICREREHRNVSWAEVFGPNLPCGTGINRMTVSRSRVGTEEIIEAASPLIEALRQAYEARRHNRNIWKNGQILSNLCAVLEIAEGWEAAAEYFDALAAINREAGDFHLVADARLRQAQALHAINDLNGTEAAVTMGLEVIEEFLERVPPYRTQLRLLNLRATIHAERREYREAFNILAEECLPLASDRCSYAAVASVENRLGMICIRLERIEEAVTYLFSAMKSRHRMHMISELSRTLYLLGTAFELRSQLPQAIFLWEVASRLQTKNEDIDALADTQLACGNAYFTLRGSSLPMKISARPALFADREQCAFLDSLSKEADFSEIIGNNRDEATKYARDYLRRARYSARNGDMKEGIVAQ